MRIAILMAVALVGCAAQPVWTHNTKGQQEFHADWAFCQAQGAQASASMPAGSVYAVALHTNTRDACMQGRGWYLTRP